MDEDELFSDLFQKTDLKTYPKPSTKIKEDISDADTILHEPLTSKTAVKFLLEGNLKKKVCRYCLHISPALSELDQIMHVAGTRSLYKVTIRAIVASVHPFKVPDDPNLPDKICQKCIDKALNAYLFGQQCEQAERAILNCLNDIYDKFEKLDRIDGPKRRGRQKLHPNYNTLYAEYDKVIDYAEPIINIINIQCESFTNEPELNPLECKKCCQVMPSVESLLSHEKLHPKTMWYHCRLCGKSFPKVNQLKNHNKQVHIQGKDEKPVIDTKFTCKECLNVTDNYVQHLQHIEKHKFKSIMTNIIEKQTNKLCAVCLNDCPKMVDLDEMVGLHGGHEDLMGDKTLYNILAATLPNITRLHNFIGTKICEKCLNQAITSYIFLHQFNFNRERLDICIGYMLNSLNKIEPTSNVCIQIEPNTIMPHYEEFDENLLIEEPENIDESKIKIDVLEDEYRMKTDSDSETDLEGSNTTVKNTKINTNELLEHSDEVLDNLAKNAKKTYSNKLVNGIQNTKYPVDVCSEFLTFRKKKSKQPCERFSCPTCSKHFISDYFLKRHVLKHLNRTVKCNKCNRMFKSKFYLYEHTKMVHLLKNDSYKSCNTCGRMFTEENKLKTHEKYHRYMNCQLCHKMYESQKHFDSHMQRHGVQFKRLEQNNTQTCSFCEKECSNDNELSLHVNKVHLQIKPYSCDMCEKQFYTESNLKSHKKVHSMKSEEICEFCNKKLKCRKHLVVHLRKHIGVKPFSCQICRQSFYTSSKAREHMRVLHGGKFFCKICKSTFVTKYGLKEHMNKDHSFI